MVSKSSFRNKTLGLVQSSSMLSYCYMSAVNTGWWIGGQTRMSLVVANSNNWGVKGCTASIFPKTSDLIILVQRFTAGTEMARLSWLDIRNVKLRKPDKSSSFGRAPARSSMNPPRLAINYEIIWISAPEPYRRQYWRPRGGETTSENFLRKRYRSSSMSSGLTRIQLKMFFRSSMVCE